jgi:hypothetical protein
MRGTNVEFVTELMECSRHGTLMQAFVMEALEKWSQTVINHREQLEKDMENGPVHARSWIGCAEEIKTKMEERYANCVPG